MATQPTPALSPNDQILQRLSAVELDLAIIKSNYATKEDIARLEQAIAVGDSKLENAMTAGDSKLEQAMAAGDSKLENAMTAGHNKLEQAIIAVDSKLEVKMAQLEARLIKWFVGTAVTLSAVVGTIAFSIARFIH